MSDWRQYYTKAKAREKSKKYYWSHTEKMKETREKYKEEHYDKWLEQRRKGYAKWISKPENLARKKEYQRQWYQQVKKKQEQETRKEIYRVRDILKKEEYVVDEYITVGLRKDKAGKFFFYVSENGKIKFISDKYDNINKCVKCAIDNYI